MMVGLAAKNIIKKSGLSDLTSELEILQACFENEMLPESAPLPPALYNLLSSSGKRLRPSLVYLAASFGEPSKEKLRALMVLIELMHTVSLIHDDIIDDAAMRRGQPTINTTNGAFAAVHYGDFLLGRAMDFQDKLRNTGINEVLAQTSKEMCRGELDQLRNAFSSKGQNRESYLMQIKRKTADLLEASCETGAIAGHLPVEWQRALKSYGHNLGMAFQITDDILDFTGDSIFGKITGQDMRSGIFTLPLIHAFEQCIDGEMIKATAEKRNKDIADMQLLFDAVNESGGLKYAKCEVERYKQEAIAALASLPENQTKNALKQLAVKIASRKK